MAQLTSQIQIADTLLTSRVALFFSNTPNTLPTSLTAVSSRALALVGRAGSPPYPPLKDDALAGRCGFLTAMSSATTAAVSRQGLEVISLHKSAFVFGQLVNQRLFDLR